MKREAPDGLWYQCPNCKKIMQTREHKLNAYTCEHCNYHEKVGSEAYFEILFDDNEFTELDENLTSADPLNFTDTKAYPDRIRTTMLKDRLEGCRANRLWQNERPGYRGGLHGFQFYRRLHGFGRR